MRSRCWVTLMKVEEGWKVEMRVKGERLREGVSDGLREGEMYLAAKERMKQ